MSCFSEEIATILGRLIDVNFEIVRKHNEVPFESVIRCYFGCFLFVIMLFLTDYFFVIFISINIHPRGRRKEKGGNEKYDAGKRKKDIDDIYHQHNHKHLFSIIKHSGEEFSATHHVDSSSSHSTFEQ